jgi:hypothetical protein
LIKWSNDTIVRDFKFCLNLRENLKFMHDKIRNLRAQITVSEQEIEEILHGQQVPGLIQFGGNHFPRHDLGEYWERDEFHNHVAGIRQQLISSASVARDC